MAKKSSRVLIGLVCEVCKTQNYVSEKNKVNTPSAVTFRKYCHQCGKHEMQKEKKKLG